MRRAGSTVAAAGLIALTALSPAVAQPGHDAVEVRHRTPAGEDYSVVVVVGAATVGFGSAVLVSRRERRRSRPSE